MPGYGYTPTTTAPAQTSTLPNWIAQINELALGWYTVIRRPEQSPLLRQPNAQLNVGPGGAAFTVDPNTLIIGVLAVVAVIWIVNQ